MARVPDCDFCRIVAGDEPARVVMRTEWVVAFFPTEPATLGHTLVVPADHIPDIWQLHEPDGVRLLAATLQVAHAVRRAVCPEGLNIIQSNGAVATQTVPHLHVHLVPRFHGDPLGPIWPPATDYADAAIDAAWNLVMKELQP